MCNVVYTKMTLRLQKCYKKYFKVLLENHSPYMYTILYTKSLVNDASGTLNTDFSILKSILFSILNIGTFFSKY